MSGELRREIGLGGAVVLGLGSILGTGVFVAIGLAAGVAGAGVLPATALAAALATCNGLSSAQLAAVHPVSGGSYEYGHRELTPALGFAAGWTFLCAKSASASAAALAVAGYLIEAVRPGSPASVPLAVALAVALTALAAGGLSRSRTATGLVVAATVVTLAAFCAAALPTALASSTRHLAGAFSGSGLLEATALLFVAYTGYGRVATLGEEVQDPARTIPRAVVVTLAVSMALYLAVAFAAVASAGAEDFAAAARATGAPLEVLARRYGVAGLPALLAAAAAGALLGVLLNLILGLSRVVLAMARRGDLPGGLARLDRNDRPTRAVWLVGLAIGLLAALGDLAAAWSFSAFAVLLYYAVTNLAALRLGPRRRRYPAWISLCGLVGCLVLATQLGAAVWLQGLAALAAGFSWRALRGRRLPV